MIRGYEAAAMMAGLGPRVRIEQERAVDTGVWQHVEQFAHIPGMDTQIRQSRLAQLPQQHGNTIDEGFTADEAYIGVLRALMYQMFPPTKADFQPERAGVIEEICRINRVSLGVFDFRDPMQAQCIQILFKSGLL